MGRTGRGRMAGIAMLYVITVASAADTPTPSEALPLSAEKLAALQAELDRAGAPQARRLTAKFTRLTNELYVEVSFDLPAESGWAYVDGKGACDEVEAEAGWRCRLRTRRHMMFKGRDIWAAGARSSEHVLTLLEGMHRLSGVRSAHYEGQVLSAAKLDKVTQLDVSGDLAEPGSKVAPLFVVNAFYGPCRMLEFWETLSRQGTSDLEFIVDEDGICD